MQTHSWKQAQPLRHRTYTLVKFEHPYIPKEISPQKLTHLPQLSSTLRNQIKTIHATSQVGILAFKPDNESMLKEMERYCLHTETKSNVLIHTYYLPGKDFIEYQFVVTHPRFPTHAKVIHKSTNSSKTEKVGARSNKYDYGDKSQG